MEFNGKALADRHRSQGPRPRSLVKAGEQLDGFAQLRDDGTTALRLLDLLRRLDPEGQPDGAARQLRSLRPGQTLNWALAWPANRRILYNRASCDPSGKPWDPKRKLIALERPASGAASDVPDFKPDVAPGDGMGPFIMNPEGVARFFAVDKMAEGPFPEHYEPFEIAARHQPAASRQSAGTSAIRRRACSRATWRAFGKAQGLPYVATTYRLTEHFHYWTKHARINAILQPEQFVEIGEELAKEKGIKARRQGQGALQPRRDQGRGGGDQAHQAARRSNGKKVHTRRHPDPLGLQGRGQERATSPTR